MTVYRIGVGAANLRSQPKCDAPLETQLLFGENFTVESEQNGWARGKSVVDDYQGYVQTQALAQHTQAATHRVVVARSLIYQTASAKTETRMRLGLGALLSITGDQDGFAEIADGGFIPQHHICAIDVHPQKDFVAVAESLMGIPYLWGGRDTSLGIDCSALLQLALAEIGVAAPRNSSQQEKMLGVEAAAPLKRGDLIFWQAHIGIMLDEATLLHANTFHMCVTAEPLVEARPRIQKIVGDMRAIKRL